MITQNGKTVRSAAVTGTIGRKTAVWLPDTNQYVLCTPPRGRLAALILAGHTRRQVLDYCRSEMNISEERAAELEHEVRQTIKGLLNEEGDYHQTYPIPDAEVPGIAEVQSSLPERFYRIHGRRFCVVYSTARTEYLLHPRLAHLEVSPDAPPDHNFRVGHRAGNYVLNIDGKVVGAWPEDEEHTFTGQFSLRLMERLYGKAEDEWMGVLHAAGVSDGQSCVVFAGDSGAGKSTLSALLMSVGFDVLADDFLPLEGGTGDAYRNPAAISVKKEALGLLSARYPSLKSARSYHYAGLGKTVCYLPVGGIGVEGLERPQKMNCEALVYARYQPDAEAVHLEEMLLEEAFAMLVPDAWVQPSEKNARDFLEWFAGLKCYRLNYSDNEKMIEAVRELFLISSV